MPRARPPLLGGEDYTLQLSDDIEPGTYQFVCLVHTDEMKGTLEVVAPDEPTDDPAEVLARADEEFDDLADGRPLDRVELEDRLPTLEAGEVLTGRAPLGMSFHVVGNAFLPEEVEVPVDGSVTWTENRAAHTVSFNAPEGARPMYQRGPDGVVVEIEEAIERTGDPSAWDGTGFLNAGLFGTPTPAGESFTVTFTEPGTYTYQCLIHFDMEEPSRSVTWTTQDDRPRPAELSTGCS